MILPSCPAASKAACELLRREGVLDQIECLPITVESKPFVVLNPLTVLDDYSDGGDEWRYFEGKRCSLRAPSFDMSKIPNTPLFMIRPWVRASVLALVRDGVPSFCEVYERYGLTGLDFDPPVI